MRSTERKERQVTIRGILALIVLVGACTLAGAQGGPPPPPPSPPLAPVPVPPGNPMTEEKRVLGKILYWDEQVSGNDTVACGTCHSNGRSGTEARVPGINPGLDTLTPSPDDVRGSLGVPHTDVSGNPVFDAVFGFNRQVTRRAANAAVMAAYSPELFWDGRARRDFTDPETGLLVLPDRGALENQALGPILSSVEMGRDNRSWIDVKTKLARVEPLGHATSLPADVQPAIAAHPTYPELFQAAFGDQAITAQRIAFAIATYERTLVANQTPYDAMAAGTPNALTAPQQRGWNFFGNSACAACHTPPTFSNNTYRNIGVRPPAEDTGRQEVTLAPGAVDRGKFKVPTLRGVGLKANFFHNGGLANLGAVVAHYAPGNFFLDNVDPILPVPLPPPPPGQPNTLPGDLVDFLANALTDPRVAARTFPFDQPTLQAGNLSQLFFAADKTTIQWPSLQGVALYVMYRGDLADLVDTNADGLPDFGYGTCVTGNDPNPADTTHLDAEMPAEGKGFFYLKGVVDGGTVRGLGVTSAVKARVPAVLCP